jgi:hypothetical protein
MGGIFRKISSYLKDSEMTKLLALLIGSVFAMSVAFAADAPAASASSAAPAASSAKPAKKSVKKASKKKASKKAAATEEKKS